MVLAYSHIYAVLFDGTEWPTRRCNRYTPFDDIPTRNPYFTARQQALTSSGDGQLPLTLGWACARRLSLNAQFSRSGNDMSFRRRTQASSCRLCSNKRVNLALKWLMHIMGVGFCLKWNIGEDIPISAQELRVSQWKRRYTHSKQRTFWRLASKLQHLYMCPGAKVDEASCRLRTSRGVVPPCIRVALV